MDLKLTDGRCLPVSQSRKASDDCPVSKYILSIRFALNKTCFGLIVLPAVTMSSLKIR